MRILLQIRGRPLSHSLTSLRKSLYSLSYVVLYQFLRSREFTFVRNRKFRITFLFYYSPSPSFSCCFFFSSSSTSLLSCYAWIAHVFKGSTFNFLFLSLVESYLIHFLGATPFALGVICSSSYTWISWVGGSWGVLISIPGCVFLTALYQFFTFLSSVVDIEEYPQLKLILSQCCLHTLLRSYPWKYLVFKCKWSNSCIFATTTLWLFNSYNLLHKRKVRQGDFFLLWRIANNTLSNWYATSCMSTLSITYRGMRWGEIWLPKDLIYVLLGTVNQLWYHVVTPSPNRSYKEDQYQISDGI